MPISAQRQKRYKEGESIPGIRVSNNQNRQQPEQAATRTSSNQNRQQSEQAAIRTGSDQNEK
jgi:hypothetical protein